VRVLASEWSERTLQRWQTADGVCTDHRPLRQWQPPDKLTEEERTAVLKVALRGIRPSAAESDRAAPVDRGEYLASESPFYRLLKAENQMAHRHAERHPKARRKPKAVSATVPSQVYSGDITYLPTAIPGSFSISISTCFWTGSAARSSVGRCRNPSSRP
jgi:hypothetical protein